MSRRLAPALLVALLVVAAASAQSSEVSGTYVAVRTTAGGQDWLELGTFPPSSVRSLTPRPVPGELRSEIRGVFSPDGSKLVFERRTPRMSKLLVLDLVTGALRTAAQYAGSRSWQYAWSQDSRGLLYAIWTQEPNVVRRLAVDGSGETVISQFRNTGGGLTWPEGTSPDGWTALVVESHGEPRVFHHSGADNLYAVRSGAKVKLATANSVSDAAWSPDGTLIAYTADCYSICRIEVVRPDGTGRRPLRRFGTSASIYEGFDELSFAWGGHASEVIYGRGRTLYGIDAESGTQRRIRTFPCPQRSCTPRTIIRAVSHERDMAIVAVEAVTFDGIQASRLYLVSLLTGSITAADELRHAADISFSNAR